ncbi:hypothetical protein HU200_061352 [Digitaria exilis]|uniref:Ornithine decarboxylase n=1 Tax=Digitaria exilis TaxID=1010633 RepID=A0A835DY22_9POAL|nr:hypothetical protein HU200_061352 [Digitaria exilis]
MRAVLEAPGVKGQEVLRLPYDATNEKDAVTSLVRRIVTGDDPPSSAFNVLNLGKVTELFAAWRRGLKGVPPYYAPRPDGRRARARRRRRSHHLSQPICSEVAPLLDAARKAGLAVSGVAFHVESTVSRVGAYDAAVQAARAVFDTAAALSCVVNVSRCIPRPVPVASACHLATGEGDKGGEAHPSTVFGPTLDPSDVVVQGYPLLELRIGDWLVFHDVGAYATILSCNFTGFFASEMKTYLASSV